MLHSFVGIDHVQLAAPPGCEEQARRFFHDVLGMQEIPKPDPLRKRGGLWFQCGVHQLHIGIENNFVAARKAHPAIRVSNLGALRLRFTEHGVAIVEDTELGEVERLYVDDPFGNRLEFFEARQ